MFNRTLAMALAIAASAFSFTAAAVAEDYPARPVTIIVPQPPGGGTDIISRIVGAQLQKQTGQTFVIDNRTGAGTIVGTVAAANAQPDGYTLLTGLNANMAVNSALYAT